MTAATTVSGADGSSGNAAAATTTTATAEAEAATTSLALLQQQERQRQQLPPLPTPLPYIVVHKNVNDDGVGCKAVLEGATSPAVLKCVSDALRTTIIVSLPLFVLGIHPRTAPIFGLPQMLIASVIATSTHRNSVGEHIGVQSWAWRGIAYALVCNTVFAAWHVRMRTGAWWGMIALGIFVASLVGHGIMRRFLYVFFFVMMMESSMFASYFGVLPLTNASYFTGDLLLGSVFGLVANLLPVPTLTATHVDELIARIFDGVGKMHVGMQRAVWSPDPHAALLFFFADGGAFVRVEEVMTVMPTLLWFANWEPAEFVLRNPIRRLKLALLRRVLALTYAAFSAGHTLAQLRKARADRMAMNCIRADLDATTGRRTLRATTTTAAVEATAEMSSWSRLVRRRHSMLHRATADTRPATHDNNNNNNNNNDSSHVAAYDEHRRIHEDYIDRARPLLHPDVYAQLRLERDALHANSHEHVLNFVTLLSDAMTRVGKTSSTPAALLEHVPFAALQEHDTRMRHNLRMAMLQSVHYLDTIRAAYAATAANARADNNKGSSNNNNSSSEAAALLRRMPAAATGVVSTRDVVHDDEVFITLYTFFFHLLLSLIAGELQSFAEQLHRYRPAAPLRRRLLDYFVLEPWHEFCDELVARVTLARPSDVRTLKDAVRMTCAFLAACVFSFEGWVPATGPYFYGTTILLGLPVEEESLSLSMCRLAGNVLGCALGFFTRKNATTFAQQVALVLCLTCVQLVFKNHTLFGPAFLYSAIITMAGLEISLSDTNSLMRVMSSSYTIAVYMICCLVVFPNSCIKVLWSYRVKLSRVMSEVLDDVAATARLPLADGARTPWRLPANNTATATTATTATTTTQQQQEAMWWGVAHAHEPTAMAKDHSDSTSTGNGLHGHTDASSHTRERGGSGGSGGGGGGCMGNDTTCLTSAATAAAAHDGDAAVLYVRHASAEAERLCAQLNVQLDLLRRLIALSSKWTPFAAREQLMRGATPFPAAASASVHVTHRRMIASLRLLVFGVQLLHRPRTAAPRPLLRRLLRGPVADFLDHFAAAARVLLQDHIDALQHAVTWSPQALTTHTAQLMRLRARLQTLLYEVYITCGLRAARVDDDDDDNDNGNDNNTGKDDDDNNKRTKMAGGGGSNNSDDADDSVAGDVVTRVGSVAMTTADLQRIAADVYAAQAARAAASTMTAVTVAAADDDNNNKDAMTTTMVRPAAAAADATQPRAVTAATANDDNDGAAATQARLLACSFAAERRGSLVAEQFLRARAVAAAVDDADADGDDDDDDSTSVAQARQQQTRPCGASTADDTSKNNYNNADDATVAAPACDNKASMALQRSFALGTASAVFRYTAPLPPERIEASDKFCDFVESAEQDVAAALQRTLAQEKAEAAAEQQQRQQQRQQLQPPSSSSLSVPPTTALSSAEQVRAQTTGNMLTSAAAAAATAAGADTRCDATADNNNNNSAAAAAADVYAPMPPRARSKSTLVLLPSRGVEAQLPRYHGPDFSYREDDVDLPIDTDHLALVSLLASCNALMDDFEQLVSGTKATSAFQKQLHDTTLAPAWIARVSNAVVARRKRVKQRYGLPPPPPAHRGPVNMQWLPFGEWDF